MKRFLFFLFLPIFFSNTAFAHHKDAESVSKLIACTSLLEQSALLLRSSNGRFDFLDLSIANLSKSKKDLQHVYTQLENDKLSDAGRAEVEEITSSLSVGLLDAFGLPGTSIKDKLQGHVIASGLDCKYIELICGTVLSVFIFATSIAPYIISWSLPYLILYLFGLVWISSGALFTIFFVLTISFCLA